MKMVSAGQRRMCGCRDLEGMSRAARLSVWYCLRLIQQITVTGDTVVEPHVPSAGCSVQCHSNRPCTRQLNYSQG